MVALTLLVFHRTDSGTAVGLLVACQFGPILLLSAWAGVVVDRTDKRRLLVVTQALEMAQSFALAALAFLPAAPLGAFYAVALVGGTLLAFDNPVRRSFVNEMVPVEDVPNAVTLYLAMVNMSRVAGPALAGVLVVTVGYGWSFTIDAVSYVTVLVALAMMRASELRRVPVTPRGPGQIRAGLRYIAGVPELWITFVMLLVIGTVSYNFPVMFPLFVERGLGGDDTAYTLVYAAFSAGSLLGAVLVARRTVVGVRPVAAGAAWIGVTMLGLAFVPDVAVALVVAVAVGVATIAYMTATTALAQIRTEPHMIGRVLAIQTVLVAGTTPIGGPLLGAVADWTGARAPVVIGGLAALAAAAFGVLAERRGGLVDQHPRERRPRRARDALLAQRLQAHVVGAGVQVRVHHLGDLLGGAVGHDRVDQAVRAAAGQVGLGEPRVAQPAGVIGEAQVELREATGHGSRALRVALDDARQLRRHQRPGAQALARAPHVVHGDEVRVRAGGALACEVEHPRAERRQAAAVHRGRRGRRVEAVEEGAHRREGPAVVARRLGVADADPEHEAAGELRPQGRVVGGGLGGVVAPDVEDPGGGDQGGGGLQDGAHLLDVGRAAHPPGAVAEVLHDLRRLTGPVRAEGAEAAPDPDAPELHAAALHASGAPRPPRAQGPSTDRSGTSTRTGESPARPSRTTAVSASRLSTRLARMP